MGSAKNSNAKLYTSKELSWSDADVDLLGIKLANGRPTTQSFDECIDKMEKVCSVWYYQQLTLSGKILLINSLMGSLFVYKMAVLPELTNSQLKRIDKIITKFIWKGKRSKIPLKVLRNPKYKGGLKLVDFAKKQTSLKIGWIVKMLDYEELGYAYYWLDEVMGELIWKANLNAKDIIKLFPESHWRTVLMEWSKCHYNNEFSGEEVRNQLLWYNSCIRMGGLPLKNNKCVKAGLITFRDLLDEEGKCLSFDKISNEFNGCLTWLQYYQLIKSILNIWWYLACNGDYHESNSIDIGNLKNKTQVSQYLYNYLIEKNAVDVIRKYYEKFLTEVGEITVTEYCNFIQSNLFFNKRYKGM